MNPSAAALDALLVRCQAAEHLNRSLNEQITASVDLLEAAEAEVARLNHENAALEAEGRTLREALAPFAGIVFADSNVPEEWILNARAALGGAA